MAASISSRARTGTRRHAPPHRAKNARRGPRAGRSTAFAIRDFSNNYIDDFSDLPIDVDGDGYPDVATVTWFGKKISRYRNPGKSGGSWTETTINSGYNIEFAVLADIDNDGRAREVVAQENGTGQAWYEVADHKWIKHVVSDKSYGHGSAW